MKKAFLVILFHCTIGVADTISQVFMPALRTKSERLALKHVFLETYKKEEKHYADTITKNQNGYNKSSIPILDTANSDDFFISIGANQGMLLAPIGIRAKMLLTRYKWKGKKIDPVYIYAEYKNWHSIHFCKHEFCIHIQIRTICYHGNKKEYSDYVYFKFNG